MYNDTITATNKIITETDLLEIFDKMNEKIEFYRKQAKQEEMQNQMIDYNYQNWNLKHYDPKFKVSVYFYDDTSIDFDNYNNFLTIFNNRISEIKTMYVHYNINYSKKYPGMDIKYYRHSITINIYENKIKIDVSLNSEDQKIDDVYEFIKNKILSAQPKYDRIIKKKKSIINKVSFGIGIIPAIIISTLALLIPEIREVFSSGYILYPICCLLLSVVIGTIFNFKVNSLYESLITDKKYAGYDAKKKKSVYTDDIEKYTSSAEILIGKNADNLNKRKQIAEIESKQFTKIFISLLVMILISVIVILL